MPIPACHSTRMPQKEASHSTFSLHILLPLQRPSLIGFSKPADGSSFSLLHVGPETCYTVWDDPGLPRLRRSLRTASRDLIKLKSNYLLRDTCSLRSFLGLRACLLDLVIKVLPSHAISVPEAKNIISFLGPPLGPFLSKPEASTLSDKRAITLPATQVCAAERELPVASPLLLPVVVTVLQSLRLEQCSAVCRRLLHLLLILIQQGRKAGSFILVLRRDEFWVGEICPRSLT